MKKTVFLVISLLFVCMVGYSVFHEDATVQNNVGTILVSGYRVIAIRIHL